MIENVIVRPIEHNIIIRPFVNNQAEMIERQRVVVREGVQVVQVGVQGPAGRNGLMLDYEQDFTDCEACVVNHNLGHYPVCAITSVGGAEMDAQIINITSNQLIMYFSSPTSGRVRCI